MAATLSDVTILDTQKLQKLGEKLRKMIPASCGGIGEVVVFDYSSKIGLDAHQKFDARGQCLMLVRPDHYVGLRCEPIREGAVTRYYKQVVGLTATPPPSTPCPPSSKSFDTPAVLIAGTACLAAMAATRLVDGGSKTVRKTLAVCCVALFASVLKYSMPPRD